MFGLLLLYSILSTFAFVLGFLNQHVFQARPRRDLRDRCVRRIQLRLEACDGRPPARKLLVRLVSTHPPARHLKPEVLTRAFD